MKQSSKAQKIDEARDVALDSIYDRFDEIREVAKMRIAFAERLIVLDAGTIALSFSAAVAIRTTTHPVAHIDFGFLFASWRSLAIAIGLSLLSQALHTHAYAGFARFFLANSFLQSLRRLHKTVAPKDDAFLSDPRIKRLMTAADAEGVRDTLPVIFGWLSLLFTLLGLGYLYRFGHAALTH